MLDGLYPSIQMNKAHSLMSVGVSWTDVAFVAKGGGVIWIEPFQLVWNKIAEFFTFW
jgi:hypothetical protein